jgi:hypothetical protein
MRDETLALLDLVLDAWHIGAIKPFLQYLVRQRFGGEQKMRPGRE